MVVTDAVKSLSLVIFPVFGPSKIPAFSFSSLRPWNALHKYLKQCLPLSKTFTYCFICPSFICRGGNMILFLGTNGSWMMLSPPTCNIFLSGYVFVSSACFWHGCSIKRENKGTYCIHYADPTGHWQFLDHANDPHLIIILDQA